MAKKCVSFTSLVIMAPICFVDTLNVKPQHKIYLDLMDFFACNCIFGMTSMVIQLIDRNNSMNDLFLNLGMNG